MCVCVCVCVCVWCQYPYKFIYFCSDQLGNILMDLNLGINKTADAVPIQSSSLLNFSTMLKNICKNSEQNWKDAAFCFQQI